MPSAIIINYISRTHQLYLQRKLTDRHVTYSWPHSSSCKRKLRIQSQSRPVSPKDSAQNLHQHHRHPPQACQRPCSDAVIASGRSASTVPLLPPWDLHTRTLVTAANAYLWSDSKSELLPAFVQPIFNHRLNNH
jgi:hypothetical protein